MKPSLISCGLLSIACLSAASPKGDYVLIDQGIAANQAFAILGTLTLDGSGNVAGNEAFNMVGNTGTTAIVGTYTMTTANSGTMSLSYIDSNNPDSPAVTQSYRFLMSSDGRFQAVRTDAGVLSVSQILPAQASPAKGAVALSELDRNAASGQASALLAQIAIDASGALSGTAVSLAPAGETDGSVTGTYTAAAAKGLGTLMVSVALTDDNGDLQTVTQNYRTVATSDGVMAIRMDPGFVSVATLELQ